MSDVRPPQIETHAAIHDATLNSEPVPLRVLLHREWWAFAAIFFLAGLIRLVLLPQVPSGLNADEAIRTYDAWSILQIGVDHRGAPLSPYMQAFGPGDYPASLSTLLMLPVLAFLGLEPVAARLPIAISALITILAVWWWTRREFGRLAGVIAVAMLAFSPWHLLISRLGYEGLLTPCLIAIGMVCLIRRRDLAPPHPRTNTARAFFGGAAFGLAIWNYSAPRLVVPLLLITWWWLMRRTALPATDGRDTTTPHPQPIAARSTRAAIIGLLIGAAPMLVTLATQPGQVAARAAQLAPRSATLGDSLSGVAARYAAHFDPRVMCLPDALLAVPQPQFFFASRFKYMHLHEAILMLIGLVALVLHRRNPVARWLLIWLLVFPLPAAIPRDGGVHAIRSVMGVPLLAIICGIGGDLLWRGIRAMPDLLIRARKRQTKPSRIPAEIPESVTSSAKALQRSAGFAALMLALVPVTWIALADLKLVRYYFTDFAADSAVRFQPDLCNAFRWLRDSGQQYDRLLVHLSANQAYAYYLLYTGVDPADVQQMAVERSTLTLGFEQVTRLGDAYFAPAGPLPAEPALLQWLSAQPPGTRVMILSRPGALPSLKPIARIADGAAPDREIVAMLFLVPDGQLP